ncbi:uncharacterized lipoprotein YddW (UPF0748 family) [Murinocardiopsis flavida]|uniref:Uncharacterized lipoprotein YddW (UPF0748 family) n=1 Tax=Murinocardiopsis flavida TaxID=645275 RepID=A0A2P8DSB9_9ACTN|nr:family 10 glycosylhydrolase [Murinocardiopsis flavida]PSL00113.1 uncharacterized lipoprotein YddW (UPF0748 family) [Murinocardiopsis flavida]
MAFEMSGGIGLATERELRGSRAGWRTRLAVAAVGLPLAASCASLPPDAAPNTGQSGSEGAQVQTQPIPKDCPADPADKREMRGEWIATVRNIDWPSKSGLSKKQQHKELRAQLDRAEDIGLNAVMFHVRPTADALYRSDKEPWSRALTGKQGGDPGYDPLEFAVAEAHKRGIELHAWFNPYRVGWQDPDVDGLVKDHPARKNPEWLVKYADQGYLDPGNPDVRKWVSGVVLDVVDRYDIDGVHFDDYFYPYPAEGETFDDDASWKKNRGDFKKRGDWRRDNVNKLVADVHTRINDTKPWVQFGISPFGIWRNKSSDSAGSDSSGLESYDAQHADTRAWIKNGWVDYVNPQLYWYRGLKIADYEKLVPWWAEEVKGTDVDLYIGQAAYKAGDEGWKGAGSLSRQLDFSSKYPEVGGDVYFSAKDLDGKAKAAIDKVTKDHYARPALPPQADDAQGTPAPVAEVRAERKDGGVRLAWDAVDDARFYAVYRTSGAKEDLCGLNDPANLIDVVGPGAKGLEYTDGAAPKGDANYHVTVLDNYRTESDPSPAARVQAR